MVNLNKRYDFLVREHKRLHDLVEYMESDSVSSKALTEAKKRKLAIKEELYKLEKELDIATK